MIEFDLINGVVIELDLVDDVVIQTNLIEGPVLEFDLMTGGVGPQGPQGPAGPPGGSTVDYTAGENLSAGRVIMIEGGLAFYFQQSDPTHAGRAVGITTTSATTGNTVSVQKLGDITDVSFSGFSDKLLWVGDDGELQDTPPATGLLQKGGIGIGNNKVAIDFSQQIIQIF